MKVAIYCRVSTEEQTTENQRIRLEEYAQRMGYTYEIIEEQETTRKTRPKKNELLQRLRHKEFDAYMVYKLDRWARSMYELTSEVKELFEKGIMFISYSENIDLSSATGRLQFHILCAFAEFERALIRERTLEGLNRAKAQGKTLGRPKGSKDKKRRKKGGYYMRYMEDK
jgi:putative DNA-invertase from lambdoid prophage Rac